MDANKNMNWEKDFREFLDSDACSVPVELSQSVQAQVNRLLHPSPWSVFTKVLLVQFVVGFASLLYCPQFGVKLTSSHGLMHYLMQYGAGVCMLGCGALFTGLSLLASALLLRPEEVRALRSHRLLHLGSVATLSIGAFLCIGAEVVLSLGLIWMLGSIVGGLASLELGWRLRRWAHG